MLLAEFVGLYADYRPIRPATVDQYGYAVTSFSRFLGQPATLSDLNGLAVSRWLRHLEDVGSPFTAHTRRCTILSIWGLATELDLAPPAKHVRPVKLPGRVPETLTSAEIRNIFAAATRLRGRYNGYLWRDIARTWMRATLETSMRPGDMRTLEYPDVVACRGRLTIVQGKTGRPRRVIMSDELLTDLAEWHSPDGLVWPMGSRGTIIRKLNEVGVLADVHLTHTRLRKTAITDVERQCPGAGWIFAGHSTPTTTRGWYIDQDAAYADLPTPNFFEDKEPC